MNESLYLEYIKQFMPQLVASIVERLNEKRQQQLPYLYRDLLIPRYSADSRWVSVLAEYNRVAADVVALDSELPVKQRDSLATATGDIPKIGMKVFMTEKQMKDVDAMIAQNMPIGRIVQNIFANLPRVIDGVFERIEDMFLSGLSTGVALSERNDGTGARVDYGYYDANKFETSKSWEDKTASILDDIQKVFDKALEDGNTITDVWLDDYALSNIYKNDQCRGQYAFIQGFAGQTSNVPVLDLETTTQVLSRKWGVNVHRVARSVKTEVNGVKKNHKPWAKGSVVFTCNASLGNLVWTDVAENTRRIPNVSYETAAEFILVSQFSKPDPLREFTCSQAMVVPVINNVDQIYLIDSTKTQEEVQVG